MSGNGAVASKTVEATVAAGRSITDATGKVFKQGDTILLESAEVKRFRQLGFLAEKGEEVEGKRTGPSISANDGPRVTVA